MNRNCLVWLIALALPLLGLSCAPVDDPPPINAVRAAPSAPTNKSIISGVCALLRLIRNIDSPSGTEGGRMAGTSSPAAHNRAAPGDTACRNRPRLLAFDPSIRPLLVIMLPLTPRLH